MREQFVPYELSVKLKELGFKEECFAGYNDSKTLLMYYPNECSYGYCEINHYNGCQSIDDIGVPLWQQAFDFIRNKYLHSYSIHRGHKKQDYYYIFEIYNPFLQIECESKMFDTYEEARLACLEKLIELCEKN